jgi:hypothetical protein
MLSGVWNTNNAEALQQGYVAKSDAKVLTGNSVDIWTLQRLFLDVLVLIGPRTR